MVVSGIELGGWLLRSRLSGGGPAGEAASAARLRQVLAALGPAFSKIGQALSSRPDLLSATYLAELERLQDQLPPFATELAMQCIEDELGAPLAATFSSISEEPVAAVRPPSDAP